MIKSMRWSGLTASGLGHRKPLLVPEKGGLKMAYKISADCIMCGSCQANCPADAIAEGDAQYVIDPDLCLSCGTCAENCPVGAISEE